MKTYLAGWVVKENLEVLDTKVGNTNISGFAGRNLLHLFPCLDEVPVWVVLLQIIWVSR